MSDNRNTINYIEKFKEFRSLLFFFIGAIVFSTVLMNLLVLPISTLAVKKPNLFTTAAWILIAALIVFFVIRRFHFMLNRVSGGKQRFKSVLYRSLVSRCKKFLYLSAIILLSSFVLFLMYILLNYNNKIISDLLK